MIVGCDLVWMFSGNVENITKLKFCYMAEIEIESLAEIMWFLYDNVLMKLILCDCRILCAKVDNIVSLKWLNDDIIRRSNWNIEIELISLCKFISVLVRPFCVN